MENHHFEADERTQFQVDRIAFFSDAVIAIAITLLILEIKIPPIGHNTTLKDLSAHISPHTVLSLIGMAVCFFSIGNLWVQHHGLYQHVRNYNSRLVRFNLYFLGTIMLLPLSTSFTMEPDNPPFLAPTAFFVNLGLCYLTYFMMLQVVFSSRHRFAPDVDKLTRWNMRRHAAAMAAVFLVGAAICFFGYYRLFYAFFAYPPLMKLWKRWDNKRYKQRGHAQTVVVNRPHPKESA